MLIQIQIGGKPYQANLKEPIDISIPLKSGANTVNCFYAPMMETTPVIAGDFIGSTKKGGPVNFLNVKLNPHGNGTHTECVGHIAKENFTINDCLKTFVFPAYLTSIYPVKQENGDRIITKEQFTFIENYPFVDALIIRSLPNTIDKCARHYSGTNAPYIQADALTYLAEKNIKHLLIDLPSVDREEDEGKVAGHHAFWNYPINTRTDATITELIFVPNTVKDGLYLLNIQIASFEIDVSPSKPVLYYLQVDN